MKVKDIFSKIYDDIEIPSSKVVEWISIGLSIHHEGDKCKFCGGNPNLEFIRHNIEKYNSNEKQKAAVALNDFKTRLEILLLQIDNLLLVKDNINNNLEKDISNHFNNIQTSREALEKIKEIVVKKIENINLEIYLNHEETISLLNEIEKSYNEIILEKKNEIKLIDDKISKLNILIKGAIGLEIRRNTFINNNIELAEEKRKALKEINTKNKENLNKIEKLKMSKSNTKDFAEHILEFKVKNSLPTYSNFNNIKLVLCGNNPSRNDELAIGTLLNVCNILSHKASRNPDEILKAAKFLMKKIKNVDELHFNTMKE